MDTPSKPKVCFCIYGKSGHAKVVASVIRDSGDDVGFMILTTDPTPPQVDRFIIAIGDNRVRQRFDDERPWGIAVHPSATVDLSARIGPGSQILYNAVVEPDVVIGRHVIINSGATVAHDCIIEDYAHIGPGVHLGGGVVVRRGVFLGIGSAVIPRSEIGEWTIIGAGSVIVRSIPANKLAYGVPARIHKDL
jgi:sugar O-acyltransferase (sialic acid O-acetyltransferase NeuD family)